jgi:hypothetical protein
VRGHPRRLVYEENAVNFGSGFHDREL